MNKHLIPKTEFASLLESAKASDAAKEKVWFTIADRILRWQAFIAVSHSD
jgi:hypothetical protein